VAGSGLHTFASLGPEVFLLCRGLLSSVKFPIYSFVSSGQGFSAEQPQLACGWEIRVVTSDAILCFDRGGKLVFPGAELDLVKPVLVVVTAGTQFMVSSSSNVYQCSLDTDGFRQVSAYLTRSELPLLLTLHSHVILDDAVSALTVNKYPDCPALFQLFQQDFTACRCQVHLPPITKRVDFAGYGCCTVSPGKAGVIKNAFYGESHVCNAEDGTRVQDKKLLKLVLSEVDPGILSGHKRSKALSTLCTSSEFTTLSSFGNGYCYLQLLSHDAWWRAARLLGPNPSLGALARVLLWVGRAVSERHRIVPVASGFYHVESIGDGVLRSDAGRQIHKQLLELAARFPQSRIG